ncbi:MAG: hypothetical protein V1851_00995 [Patescibacteria group bacterium]
MKEKTGKNKSTIILNFFLLIFVFGFLIFISRSSKINSLTTKEEAPETFIYCTFNNEIEDISLYLKNSEIFTFANDNFNPSVNNGGENIVFLHLSNNKVFRFEKKVDGLTVSARTRLFNDIILGTLNPLCLENLMEIDQSYFNECSRGTIDLTGVEIKEGCEVLAGSNLIE